MTHVKSVRPSINAAGVQRQQQQDSDDEVVVEDEDEADGKEPDEISYTMTDGPEDNQDVADVRDVDDLFGGDEQKGPAAEGADGDEQRHQDTGMDDKDPVVKTQEPMKDIRQDDSRIPTTLTSPIRPTAEDVEKHYHTHLPYRNWCPVCVKARGREDPHRRGATTEEDKSGLPIISIDYQELSEDTAEKQRIIVGKDEPTGNVFAHYVICKGIADDWAAKRLVKDIEDLGRSSIILKSDGEPAIKALQSRVQALRGDARTVPRTPPAYNPESNGPCEKAVQDVTAQLRTIKLGLEHRIGQAINEERPIVQWMLEHATFLLNKFSVGRDGMTPFERATGRKWKRPLVEFGECVLAKMTLKKRQHGKTKKQKMKLAARSIYGTWVGQVARSGEHIVIKSSGDAVRCRTVRRIPKEKRWNAENVLTVEATPRCPAPNSKEPEKIEARLVDDEVKPDVDDKKDGEGGDKEYPSVRADHTGRRNFRITQALLDVYGYHPGCEGCEWKASGLPGHRPHSQACRDRLYRAAESDGALRGAVDRAAERLQENLKDDEPNHKDENVVKRDEGADVPMDDNDDNREGAETPKFGGSNQDDDEIPELQEIESDDEEITPEANMEGDEDDEDGSGDDKPTEPNNKRQRVQLISPQLLNFITKQNQTGAEKLKQVLRDLEKIPKFQIPTPKQSQVRSEPFEPFGDTDVAEAYSPPRITKMAKSLGMKSGFAIDLTCIDEDDNMPWDFNVSSKRAKAKQRVTDEKPFMLILSPMCGPFSQLQTLFNYGKASTEDIKQKIAEAMIHLKFAIELCLIQHRAGRRFIFEHPHQAHSWSTEMVEALGDLAGVHHLKFDFCTLGMKTRREDGEEAHAKKRTGILTNSDPVAYLLRGAQCRGGHFHQHLTGGRAHACQEYPPEFCRLICEGIKRDLDTVEWRRRLSTEFDITPEFRQIMALMEKVKVPPEEDPFEKIYDGCEFVDDVHGVHLEKNLAIKARKIEMEFFKTMGVYTKVVRQPWMKVVSTKWIDTNKGDEVTPNYRARLVARELNLYKREDLFAATPPLESLRMLLSICANNQGAAHIDDRYVVMSNDVKRAYFYAPSSRPLYIAIPTEDFAEGDEQMVGQLNLSLYGTRDAALNWSKTYTEFLVNNGFIVGQASPCNFTHSTRNISMTVHGDDFTSTGKLADMKWLQKAMEDRFEIKTDILGPRTEHAKQIRVLNRVISWQDDCIAYESDQRHAELIVAEMGVTSSVVTPGCREEAIRASAIDTNNGETTTNHGRATIAHDPYNNSNHVPEQSSPKLSPERATKFRALAARANFLAQDRPDIQYAVKEIARRMSTPSEDDWILIKRLARYLVGAPRAVLNFYWQQMPKEVDVFVDADWAGCKHTRRSTSGGAAMFGWHCVKSWSSTQAIVALSSGESELYAMTKGAAQALGLISLAGDFGLTIGAKIHCDANATLGIVNRQGLGKLRHLNVQYLWIQERVRNGDLSVTKVYGKENPADLMTKHLPALEMAKHSERINLETGTNRAETAPQLAYNLNNFEPTTQQRAKPETWQHTNNAVTMQHNKSRKDLYTPIGVRGAPPLKSLATCRITNGEYIDDGSKFRIIDNWKSRNKSKSLERRWIGSTTFLICSDL